MMMITFDHNTWDYLRTTMTSQRLNSVVVLNVQRDELDIPAVADEFVHGNSVRKDIFG